MIDSEVEFWFDLYGHYQGKTLWTDGGVSNQPNSYLDVMREIQRLNNTVKTRK